MVKHNYTVVTGATSGDPYLIIPDGVVRLRQTSESSVEGRDTTVGEIIPLEDKGSFVSNDPFPIDQLTDEETALMMRFVLMGATG